jgi:hypothetical protein
MHKLSLRNLSNSYLKYLVVIGSVFNVCLRLIAESEPLKLSAMDSVVCSFLSFSFFFLCDFCFYGLIFCVKSINDANCIGFALQIYGFYF